MIPLLLLREFTGFHSSGSPTNNHATPHVPSSEGEEPSREEAHLYRGIKDCPIHCLSIRNRKERRGLVHTLREAGVQSLGSVTQLLRKECALEVYS